MVEHAAETVTKQHEALNEAQRELALRLKEARVRLAEADDLVRQMANAANDDERAVLEREINALLGGMQEGQARGGNESPQKGSGEAEEAAPEAQQEQKRAGIGITRPPATTFSASSGATPSESRDTSGDAGVEEASAPAAPVAETASAESEAQPEVTPVDPWRAVQARVSELANKVPTTAEAPAPAPQEAPIAAPQASESAEQKAPVETPADGAEQPVGWTHMTEEAEEVDVKASAAVAPATPAVDVALQPETPEFEVTFALAKEVIEQTEGLSDLSEKDRDRVVEELLKRLKASAANENAAPPARIAA